MVVVVKKEEKNGDVVEVVWAGETIVELWCWRQENSRIVVVVVVEKINRTVAALEGKH